MKKCPTCQQQFPNGFQYCPNDTDALVPVEEQARRVQPVTPAPSPVEAVQPKTPPAEVLAYASSPPSERVTERIEEPEAVLPPRATEKVIPPANGQSNGQSQAAQNQTATTQPITVRQTVSGKAPATARIETDSLGLLLPAERGIIGRIGEGLGVFFTYFGKRMPQVSGDGRFSYPEEESLLKRLGDGLRIFFAYFGKKQAPVGAIEEMQEQSLVRRLGDLVPQFINNFGKQPPPPKPGEMGDFQFLLKEETILQRVGRELRQAGADFRRDPRGFVVATLKGDGTAKRQQRLLQAGVASALIAYAFIFTTFLFAGLINFGRGAEEVKQPEEQLTKLIDLTAVPIAEPKAEKVAPEIKGKGGFTGGSKPKIQQASGGGGGGRQQPTPPSKGVPPPMALTPQIVMPNPEPPKIKNPTLPVPMTAYGDPKALPELKGPIGDPRGVPGPPSSGPGTGAGIGTGSGTGVGPGQGGGVGPGRGGNAGGGDFGLGGGRGPGGRGGIEEMGRNGVGRIQILYKEKAKYTEEARQNKIQGTVVLSAVFTSDGRVTNIRVIRGLPDGLTEKAIEAAQKIRFQPATKDGSPVTVRGQLEFTFNLY